MPRKLGIHPIVVGGAIAAVTAVIALAGCSSDAKPTAGAATAPTPAPAANLAQARVDAFAEVAQRIYAREHANVVGRTVASHLLRNAALMRALTTGDRRTIRAQARKPVITHEVRIRVTRGPTVLMDAGLPNVVEGAKAQLPVPGAAPVQLQVSIQDLIGFVKLVDRETGVHTVVREQNGTVQTLFPAAAHQKLPASGPVTIKGHTYVARSFGEKDFVGKPLTVWVLEPA